AEAGAAEGDSAQGVASSMARCAGLQYPLESGAARATGEPSPLGDRPAIDLTKVAGEVDGAGTGDVAADAKAVDRRAALQETLDLVRVEPAADEDPDVPVAGQIQLGAQLDHQFGSDAAALGGRVHAHSPKVLAKRAGNAQALLDLITERVYQHGSHDARIDMPVERLGRGHRVAHDQDQRVGHGAGGLQVVQLRSGRCRSGSAAADDGCVVHDVGHLRMDVSRAEADHRDAASDPDAAAG